MALVEEHLSEQVAKNVGKCIKMFAVKTEQQIETGPEAAQVIGKFNYLFVLLEKESSIFIEHILMTVLFKYFLQTCKSSAFSTALA